MVADPEAAALSRRERNRRLDDANKSGGIRNKGHVVLAGIVGVPWQDIARRNAGGDPDLFAGLDLDGNTVGGYMSAAELVASGAWNLVLGSPALSLEPSDPHMIESIEPRFGLPAPGAGYYADPIHGHDWTVSQNDDLQYACIFPLAQPRECMPAIGPPPGYCDCFDTTDEKPLCIGATGGYGTVQSSAKAYPGLRELAVLQTMVDGAVVGSICPAQQNDAASPDFGYTPAMNALFEALRARL